MRLLGKILKRPLFVPLGWAERGSAASAPAPSTAGQPIGLLLILTKAS